MKWFPSFLLSSLAWASVAMTSASSAEAALGGTSPSPFVPDDSAGTTFGAPSSVVITGEADLGLIIRSEEGQDTRTSLILAPAADLFLQRNLSVGGAFQFDYSKQGRVSSTTFRLLPRVGYNLAVSSLLSVWGRAGLGISRVAASTELVNGVTAEVSGWSIPLVLDAKLLAHLHPHFFVGAGPEISVDLFTSDGGNSVFSFAIFRLLVGGTF